VAFWVAKGRPSGIAAAKFSSFRESHQNVEKGDQEMPLVEMRCPNCGARIILDEEDLDPNQEISCPYCGESVEVDDD